MNLIFSKKSDPVYKSRLTHTIYYNNIFYNLLRLARLLGECSTGLNDSFVNQTDSVLEF